MSAPDKDESDRIAKWRAERAELAEEQRAERLRVAEEERQERLRQAERDKEERVRQAKEKREAEIVAQKQAEEAAARALLPDADALENARQQIVRSEARQRRRWWMAVALWVILPCAFVAYYTTQMAVPLYEARSVVVVSKAGSDSSEGLGGLLGTASSQANLREAFMAHEYVRSQALMDELEDRLGLVTRYSGADMDPLRRLRNIPALRLSPRDQFDRFVASSINIQTGLMDLYVRAPTPEMAVAHSDVILDLMATQINSLSDELFASRVEQAQNAVLDAELGLQEAQAELTQLQIDSGEVDPRARIEGIFDVISQLQAELQTLRSEIDRSRVAGEVQAFSAQRFAELEDVLTARINEQRALMVRTNDDGELSLNQLLLEYEQAQLKSRVAQETLTAALASLSEAREKAVLGRSQFQIVVPPRTGPSPTSPNPLTAVLITFITMLALFSVYQLLLSRPRD